ncbi:MAG: DUF2207 domain-containing protein, partial [Planctomycetes bacterium]|nr:DUF2207 domain-containing protein [Planctomycetota bacterium]
VVVPERSTLIEFPCGSCGHKISVPERQGGKKGACPKCKNPVVVPPLKKVPAESDTAIPPTADEDIDRESLEEYEEPEGVDRRLIILISVVAVIAVVGLVLWVVVLRPSRPQEQVFATGEALTQLELDKVRTLSQQYTSLLENDEIDEALQLHPFRWTSIDVEIDVQKDGDLLISERQEYSFEPGPSERRHVLSRRFLMDWIDDIQDVEVFELRGNGETSSNPLPRPHAIQTDQNDLWICWSHELDPPEIHTFLLKYRVVGAIYVGKRDPVPRPRSRGIWRFFEAIGPQQQRKIDLARARSRASLRDELYWDAVIWPRPAVVDKATVTVRLPSELRGQIVRLKRLGDELIRPDIGPDSIGFDSSGPIPRETGLEIYIGFTTES